MDNPKTALYAVQRCRKDGSLYGQVHASADADCTVCGVQMNHNWWIIDNTHSLEPACPRCRDTMDSKPLAEW